MPSNFAAATNLVLERYAQAAQAAEHAATATRQKLDKAQMSAEISRRYALFAAGNEAQASSGEVVLLPQVEATPPGVLDYYDQWLGEQTRKTSNKSGQDLSKSYLASLANTRDVLEDFAGKDAPLALPALDHA
ncbi:hypothetical protein [Hymenobacter negativus]|uniref:Uncharacterized protein n=1 Tax=Hymenobacter negativus TaxID=2795026 RepID=A0ABS3Q8M3_9BACT|nr:hypothetical protein [Hymenobacter negativus]MBO2007601.1 hypothetical protein [Hymenobacter negativus]